MSKPRIAILGGGVGGVTAAVTLSQGDWQQRFESITLYQQGWRLGGKGASGRRRTDLRIEEHGLHIWLGFYENAFRMLRECHEELDDRAADPSNPQPRWRLACTSMEQSFQPCRDITLTDHDGCGWQPWVADFFHFDDDTPWAVPDPRLPGERPDDWSVVFYAARCLHLAADLAESLVESSPSATIVAGSSASVPATVFDALEDLAEDIWRSLSGELQYVLGIAAEALDTAARVPATVAVDNTVVEIVLRAVDFATQVLRDRADEYLRASDTVRRAWYVIDLMLAVARGVVEDNIIDDNDFATINDVEFRAWLRSHGAARETVDSVLVRALYDLGFAFQGGDPQRPAAEAGTALRGTLRMFFTYRGSLMWKMTSGMGDVVFAPLYELLHKRGVTVEFFHRVETLHATAGVIEEIDIDVQAILPATTTASSFLTTPQPTGTSPSSTALWPAEPMVLHATSPATAPAPAAFESWLTDPAITRVGTKTLHRGSDFTHVVFALPITTVPHVAPDLIDQSARWHSAVQNIETVPTQALQLWLTDRASQVSDHGDGAVVTGYVEPYDTWADMGHLVTQEQVGSATVAYFCNVLADAPLPPRGGPAAAQWLTDQHKLVRAQALRFLRHDIRYLWPKAVDPLTGEFTWDLLVAPTGVEGPDRLDAQFYRANVEPSERYVLSVPGSSKHRVHPGHTGFANLYAAGDWTACGLDVGCVEAAVISGLLAANAIFAEINEPVWIRHVIGYDGT